MRLKFAEEFNQDFRKIKDKRIRLGILNKIRTLLDNPEVGKPQRYGYKGKRRLRVGVFRIFYSIENGIIMVPSIKHRKKAYK
jgi:mRNA-degrading endonuclease RelE of RelBE toxin-antitoxin system